MGNAKLPAPKRKTNIVRDLAAVVVMTIVLSSLAVIFALHEKFSKLTMHVEKWELDELIIILFVFSICCTCFARQGYRDLIKQSRLEHA